MRDKVRKKNIRAEVGVAILNRRCEKIVCDDFVMCDVD